MRDYVFPICLLSLVLVVGGCAQYENKRGVLDRWEKSQEFTRGVSTRQEVMAVLGPPSQVISLDGETVLYYLYERAEGNALILIVYNRMQVDTRYDRAIFFFDENDLLTDQAAYFDVEGRR